MTNDMKLNDMAVAQAEPDYKSEHKRLTDENRCLKAEVDRLHMTIVEMCIWQFTSRFNGRCADNE